MIQVLTDIPTKKLEVKKKGLVGRVIDRFLDMSVNGCKTVVFRNTILRMNR